LHFPCHLQVDARDYGVAAHILRDLGAHSVALLTNNPAKANCLKSHGLKITEVLPLLPTAAHASGSAAAAATVTAAAAAAAAPDSGSKKGPQPHFV
jgi:GTP cyclohydrolase II